MKKTKLPAFKRIRFFMLIPFLALLVAACAKNGEELSSESAASEHPATSSGNQTLSIQEGEASSTASNESEIFFIVEEMPDFQGGGQKAFSRYIYENIRYPEDAKAEGIEGRVFVQFTVKSDGTVDDAKVVRGVHESLDGEALRVILSSPEWKPGRQDDKPVNVAFTFPVNFLLKQKE